MSSTGTVPPSAPDNFSDSHNLRARFERWVLVAVLAIIVVFCLAALVGVLWRPPHKDELDYGAQVVARVISLKDTVLDFLGTLVSVFGISFARGHMDARVQSAAS